MLVAVFMRPQNPKKLALLGVLLFLSAREESQHIVILEKSLNG
jgi:hypothetical protein